MLSYPVVLVLLMAALVRAAARQESPAALEEAGAPPVRALPPAGSHAAAAAASMQQEVTGLVTAAEELAEAPGSGRVNTEPEAAAAEAAPELSDEEADGSDREAAPAVMFEPVITRTASRNQAQVPPSCCDVHHMSMHQQIWARHEHAQACCQAIHETLPGPQRAYPQPMPVD